MKVTVIPSVLGALLTIPKGLLEGCAGVVMVIVVGIGVQILGETDCISHNTNSLGKGMNPLILPPAMGK